MISKFRPILFALVWTSALGLGVARAAPTQIKFPYNVAANTLRGQSIAKFGAKLKTATKDQYQVIPYPNGSLYSGSAAANAVQLGVVQMTNAPSSAFAGYTNLVGLLEIPFAWSERTSFRKFIDGPSGDVLLAALAAKGFIGLALMDEGPMVIATKSRLIKVPRDFNGLRIRTSGHQVVVAALDAMGASTVKISLPEVYSALQQGVVNGVYTTFMAYTKDKLYEVAPNVMLFPAHGAYIWVANKAWFEKQPPNVQADIRKLSRQQADDYFNAVWGELTNYVGILQKHGGRYSAPDRQSINAFRNAIKPVYAHLKNEYGTQVIDTILAGKPINAKDLIASK